MWRPVAADLRPLLGDVFWGAAGSATMDIALTVVFIVHALCGLAFAALAHSLR